MPHTPGPWEAIKVTTAQYGSHEHGWGVIAASPMRGRIDSAIAGLRGDDARLIAAAPDLLEALKRITETHKSCEVSNGPECGCGKCYCCQAEAAIAKALGPQTKPEIPDSLAGGNK